MAETEKVPLEIERKFLIRMPDPERLARESARRLEITQIYLTTGPDVSSRRVRLSREGEHETRTLTEKVRLTGRTRIERERAVSPEEWDALLAETDPARRPITKTRWCVPSGAHTLEIEVAKRNDFGHYFGEGEEGYAENAHEFQHPEIGRQTLICTVKEA